MNQDRLEKVKNDLESMKLKKNSTQIIQIKSLDISKSYEETQKVFDDVRINRKTSFHIQPLKILKTIFFKYIEAC